ncbi:MAG: oligopeptide transporter, OPT family [Myxococcales bacterium]|nr:oligopeptide transporter, OPT family [Myxococcales bacterium]
MQSGEERPAFRPYIPSAAKMRELTWGPLLLGTVLGVIFGLSSLYLVLKVGMTVSASIPVAVISITFFRLLAKVRRADATILQNNIVQTAGSAGESIAFGVGVTMPAIMILGFDLEFWRVALVAVLGGLLGILMMIPLRRALIVEQHGQLKYPEGTACAEVLKAGASEESRRVAAEAARDPEEEARARAGGKVIFTGFGIGLLYKTLMSAFKGWKDVPEVVFGKPLAAGSLSAEISPELLGVGYIIGPRIAAVMAGGGVLAYLVLIPAIKFFGEGLAGPLTPGTVPISQMDPHDIRTAYVLYIGAGAVAAGGIISLLRSLPTIWHGIKGGLGDLRRKKGPGTAGATRPRVDRDISLKFVGVGILTLVVTIVLAPPLHMNVLGAVLIVVLGFLFVTVSSRLVGEIGSSSNPISGMTVATLLVTCIVFLLVGWTGPAYYVTALSVGAIVCIAASNAGATSQDLKTGFLVGATPRLQQIAILFGALASALALGPILLVLNQGATVYVPRVMFEAQPSERPALGAEETARLSPYAGEAPPAAGSYLTLTQPAPEQGVELAKDALPPGDYLVDAASGAVTYKVTETFAADLRVDPAELADAPKEKLAGPQAKDDGAEYLVWHKLADAEGPAGASGWGPEGKYLVTAEGVPAYLVDPGVNGVHNVRPDGSRVTKFDAPKATLMSYIIKGILNRKLPWGLVLLGVMIAIVLELAGVPSLAFAVGVYLPLSSSTPILIGGGVRWLVDRWIKKKHAAKKLSETELAAEGDKSPGVLLASGYIAGGAITGIVVLLVTGALGDVSTKIEAWSREHNPFFEKGIAGIPADLLALVPFVVLTVLLWLAGRELWLRPPRGKVAVPREPAPEPDG